MKSRSLCNERRRLTVDCSVSRMLPLAFEIEFFWVATYLVSASELMDPASAFGLHFLMQEVSVPLLLTVCLFFYSLLESSAADGRRRHHLWLLLVPQDELFGAGHVLVSWTWSFSNYSLSLSLQVHLGDGEMCIHWKKAPGCVLCQFLISGGWIGFPVNLSAFLCAAVCLIDCLNAEDFVVVLCLILWSQRYVQRLWKLAACKEGSCKSFLMSLITSEELACVSSASSQSARLFEAHSAIQPANSTPESRQHLKGLVNPWLEALLLISFSFFCV